MISTPPGKGQEFGAGFVKRLDVFISLKPDIHEDAVESSARAFLHSASPASLTRKT